jgi:hypothetical protein
VELQLDVRHPPELKLQDLQQVVTGDWRVAIRRIQRRPRVPGGPVALLSVRPGLIHGPWPGNEAKADPDPAVVFSCWG